MKKLPLIFTNTPKYSNLNFTKIENLDVQDKIVIKIKLTNLCLFNCEYCCFHYKDSFIKLNTIYSLIQEIKILNFHNIVFVVYGGEPTLHPDFYNIIDILKKYGQITILTNMGRRIYFQRLQKCSFMFTLHTKYLSNHYVVENLKQIKSLPKNKYDLVILMSKKNYKEVKKLYSVFKMMYNTSIGYVFQDIDEIPNDFLNIFNDNVVKVSQHNISKLLSYWQMIKNDYINFHGCICNSGQKLFVMNSNGMIYRCESEFINQNPLCHISDFHDKIYKISTQCSSYWCTEYWSKIVNPNYINDEMDLCK